MKGKTKPKPPDIELHPDAWERFEKAVDVVMRSPPKHRKKKGEDAKPSVRPKKAEGP
jgi:hypothetical protein